MRVQLHDEAYAADFLGFLQRAHCLVLSESQGLYEVVLPHDLPEPVARAELRAYLAIWQRKTPGGHATLIDDANYPDGR